MSKLDKYDSTSERLSDDATIQEKFIKYVKIFTALNKENIKVTSVGPTIGLVDESCGFELVHNVISWNIFRVVDVIDMIVSARDSFLERQK